MANYSSKYIANFATLTSPLRDLTKKSATFEWTKIHQTAFTDLTDADYRLHNVWHTLTQKKIRMSLLTLVLSESLQYYPKEQRK